MLTDGLDGGLTDKMRIDVALVKLGLVDSRERAKYHITAGEVFVNGKAVIKPSVMVSLSEEIKLENNTSMNFVGRGGLKLEKAIKFGGYDLKGATCLDVGASTGGFTDCMLRHGAALVYAVDVGHGQLHPKLASDPRVVNLEGKDIRDSDELLRVIPPNSADFCSIDVSFISLKKIFSYVMPFLKTSANIVCLIKPQFEAGRENIGKNCVVKNPKAHINVINELISFFKSTGFRLKGLTYSPVTGGEGNIEYLALLHQGMDSGSLLDIDNVVKEAHMVLK